MSNDPLAIYLHDHVAGAAFAIQLLEALRDHHARDLLGPFAADLLREIEQDRVELEGLIKRLGSQPSGVKEAVAWLAEKASRLKLRRHGEGVLGTFETLEALALGIRGKEALWGALEVAAVADPRLQGVDYPLLARRAQQQFAAVETRRLELAATLFALPASVGN